MRESAPRHLFGAFVFKLLRCFFLITLFFIVSGNVSAAPAKIYWVDYINGRIERSNLDGSNRQTVLSGLNLPHDIAIDPVDNKIYWSDSGTDTIRRANLDGSDSEMILSGLDNPWNLAIDSCSRKLYWTINKVNGTVYRSNLDGTEFEEAISTGEDEFASGLSLDLINGKVYWADYWHDRIRRANLDGTAIETVATDVLNAKGIALDIYNEKIYWAESHWSLPTKLERQNFDGSGRQVVIESVSAYGLAIDTEGAKLYWTDDGGNRIVRANLDGSNIEYLITTGLETPRGIVLGPDRAGRTAPAVLTCQVQDGLDDGYAADEWTQDLNEPVLYLGTKANRYSSPFPTSAMRLIDVRIPPAIEISEAYLSICSADSTIGGRVYGTIQAEEADDPNNFAARDIGSLSKTVAAVDWDHLTDWEPTTWYTSSDISSVIQEVIDRPGWSKDNALVVLYSTREKSPFTRAFSSWNRSAELAPILQVRYGGYEITGYITDRAGKGVADVEISGPAIEHPAFTNYYGYYKLYVPKGWSGIATPNKPGWVFSPENRAYSNTTEDLSGNDYAGYQPKLSGYITIEGGPGLEGVLVSINNGRGSDISDVNGYYEFFAPCNWSGSVVPYLEGWGFEPNAIEYIDLLIDQNNQNFTAFPPPVISGYIRDSDGIALAGVLVDANNGPTSDTTDSTGYYDITVPYGWSGMIIPSSSNWTLSPVSRSYNNVKTDQLEQDYTAFHWPMISGYITDANVLALESVQVSADNGGGSDTTDSNGYYGLLVPYNWMGTVTPALDGWGFAPEQRSYTNVTEDQTDQGYIAFQPKISGYVTDQNGARIMGVVLAADNGGGSDDTDTNGFYELTVPRNWSGTVARTGGVPLDPPSRSYSNVTADLTSENFILVPAIVRADGTGDYPTIQAAINAALNGDTIILEDGTYTGSGNRNLDFKGKAITVCSLNGPEVTIIDCQESSRGCNFDSGEGPDTILSGVTIKNGKTTYNAGGCIYCYGGSPTIENCIITASKCIGYNYSMEGGPCYGGGISCRGGSDPIIVGCTISNNLVRGSDAKPLEGVDWPFEGGTGYGGGVYSDASSTPTIVDCLFSGNKATGGTGYPGSGYPGWPCAGAGGHAYGGGIYTGSTVPVIIERCVFLGNAALGGDSSYGMYCGSIGNAGNGLGGGIHSAQGSAVLRNCSVVANTAHSGNGPSIYAEGVGYGGGLYGTIEITGCTFVGNSAEHRGGGVYGNSNVSTSIIWSNSAPSGAQIYGSPSVSYSDVKYGFAGQGNIDANPLLEGPVDGIYHLSQDSPCINAGDPNYVADTNELDIDGQARINGGRTDMGADEFFSPTPFVVLSAAEFDFAAWIDGNQPSPQVLLISNVGPNDMPWDITKDCSWLSVEPNSGICPAGGAQQVALRVDANGLQGGNHTCTLNIAAPNASNSPLTVLANLRVYGPVISLSSSDIDFLAATDNPHPPDQMLYIANEGFSTLNWQISLSGNCSWLTVYPTTGQSTGDVNAVTLHADAAGLEAGFYACDLIVSDFYADNNPRIVPIGLYVCPRQGLLIVPTVFGTIQEAVDAAVDGDQVVIVPGTYTGPGNFDIDVGGKEITVRSIDPNNPNTVADTILDGNSGGANDGESFGFGFFFMNAEGPNTVLEGLTITGSDWGGGIYLNQTCPTIRNCVIRDNWGNGILGSFSGDLIIEGCTIARNTGGEWGGGGITLYGAGSLTITECLIANNSSYHWGYGCGIRYYWRSQEGPPADINITDCIITGNEGDNGAGLYCEAGSCSITNSEIINNAAYDMGGGVYVFDGNCTIENTIISNNTAQGNGGGLYARYCDTTIADSVISQNRSGQEGGGLFIERCTGTITSSQISNNSATYFGGGLAGFGGPLLLSNCVLSGNEATDGGAIGVFFGPVSNCTIVGNKAAYTTIAVGRMPEPIRNCIIWDNRSEFIVDRILSLEYDCVQGGWDGLGNIELDPCFAVPGYWHPNDTPNDVNDDFWVDGDYHLKSEAGRWKPSIYGGLDSTADNFIDLTDFAAFAGYWQKEGIGLPADLDRSGTADFNDLTLLLENYLASYADGAWVYDNVTSPCIDTGNPGCPLGDEPNDANNVRVNMGAYGGRAEASKTPLDWAILADLDNDIIVDVNDLGVFCDYWLDSGECIPADLDRSGFVDFADYAILSKQWLWPD